MRIGAHVPIDQLQTRHPLNLSYVFTGLLVACIAVAIFFRCLGTDHLPGINGDEAFVGTQAYLLAHGGAGSLRTGSGLLPDPLSLSLSVLFHLIASPSATVLRLPTVLLGVATIAVAFELSRKLWGRDIALIVAALVAAMPIHIAYSRFFWEPSQSPLVCMLWLYAAYTRRTFAACALGLLALMVHPTNIFLAPVVVAVSTRPTGKRAWLAIGTTAVLALAYVHVVSHGAPHVVNLASARDFFAWLPGLVTGATVYQYIVGAPQAWAAHRIAYIALFGVPVVASLVRDYRRIGIAVGGLAAALVVFCIVAGPAGVTPHTERYGMWMTVPHCLIAALALVHLLGEKWAKLAAACVCTLWLVDFRAQYMERFARENSTSHETFLSGRIEPKVSAVAWIASHRDPAQVTVVVCDSWWSYQAVRYLSLGEPWQVTVDPTPAGQIFWVGYAGGAFIDSAIAAHPDATRDSIYGYGKREILDVLLTQPRSQ